jgi:hypothetical protein
LIILIGIGAVVVAFLTVVGIATFYEAPSCADGVQNQGEQGVDCGGSCAYLCTAELQPPTILFTQAINNGAGRVDVVASIENKNATAAAKRVPYRVQLYNAKQTLLGESSGVLDLPPGSVVPVFMPGLFSGKLVVTSAFLSIEPSAVRWYAATADPRIVPLVSNVKQSGTVSAPRVEAVLTNPSATALSKVRAVVLLRSDTGDVIAASETIVPGISALGQARATFTWNSAFSGVPASIEVVPLIPLP